MKKTVTKVLSYLSGGSIERSQLFYLLSASVVSELAQHSMYVDTCKYTSQLESVIKAMKGIILTGLYKACLCLLLISSQLRVPFTH